MEGKFLPLSHPAFAVLIADIGFLRSVLILAQQGKQFLFLRFSLYFNELSLQLRILLLRCLEHSQESFEQGWFLWVCHYYLYEQRPRRSGL